MSEFALEVSCFVLRDSLFRSEAVKHSADFAKFGFGCSFVCHLAQVANGIASCFSIVAVAQTA